MPSPGQHFLGQNQRHQQFLGSGKERSQKNQNECIAKEKPVSPGELSDKNKARKSARLLLLGLLLL